jgi:hypothetical protein
VISIKIKVLVFQANKAEHQVKKLKQTIEDIKYRYETQLANKGLLTMQISPFL